MRILVRGGVLREEKSLCWEEEVLGGTREREEKSLCWEEEVLGGTWDRRQRGVLM